MTELEVRKLASQDLQLADSYLLLPQFSHAQIDARIFFKNVEQNYLKNIDNCRTSTDDRQIFAFGSEATSYLGSDSCLGSNLISLETMNLFKRRYLKGTQIGYSCHSKAEEIVDHLELTTSSHYSLVNLIKLRPISD